MLASVGVSAPLLEVDGVVRAYRGKPVLHGVSLTLARGGSLGIVGESGSGKSTLARTILALDRPQAGTVRLLGEDLFTLSPRRLRAARQRMQAVFQDPYGSLDPRMSVARIVGEPLLGMPRLERARRVAAAIDAVGLPAASLSRAPHQFSGGQRQRIAIARGLVTEPALVVADEPVSALDVSVQAQVLNLMLELRARLGLGWVFISHDLAVVRCVAAEVAVLYRGRVVERGPTAEVFEQPLHPYTAALAAAVPRFGAQRPPAPAVVGLDVPEGCVYAASCPRAVARCAEPPVLRTIGARHVACHVAGA